MWQRRQTPPQQATTGPVPMEGVERTNAVVVRGQGQEMGAPRRDSDVIEVDRGRNCYACRGFGHMAHYCKNWEQRGRIEGNYKKLNNLKEEENLESLD